jgi:hypothetical protein
MRILTTTAFDITATGVTGNFRPEKLPMISETGTEIRDYHSWTRSRNQQRNLETVLQLAQMRSQIDGVTRPQRDNDTGLWQFEFTVERPEVYANNDDDLAWLRDDCNNVPIVIGLDEAPGCADRIHVSGNEQNVWFQVLDK